MKKTETIAEFLARGGKITKVASAEPTVKPESIRSTTAGGPAVFLSLGEADLFYGEHKAKKAKKSKAPLDLSALPEELRKKYVDGVMNGSDQEEGSSEEDDSDEE
jgi:hypothetical protein